VIAVAVVHTTGINWLSVGSLMIAFCVAVGGGVGFVIKRVDRNHDRTQAFVTDQVTTISTTLAGRLDRIDIHLAEQDKTVFAQNERLARVEGRLQIPGGPG
jgi:hypothetical protein